MVDAIHAAGAYALSFAPTLSVAQRLVDYGMDGLILEGSEAGGHIGPVSTSVLAQEILPALADRVPVWMAGGIGHGAMIAHYMRLGAVGCQIGTMFVCAEESIAHPNFKQAFIEAQARDAQASVQLDPDFPVIPVRALKNKASEDFLRFQQQALAAYRQGIATKEDTQLSIEHYWAGALRRAVMEGDMEHGSLMAGQSVGMVRAIEPAAMIVQRLVDEACRAAGV
jgi:enoyl-[acyl-carrier protein] reductase II